MERYMHIIIHAEIEYSQERSKIDWAFTTDDLSPHTIDRLYLYATCLE